MTISQQLDLASEQHKRGRLAEAEAVYRQILAVEPQNARALHLMGVMLHQRTNGAEGSELIRHAIQIDPLSADFHCNLGVILTDCGQFEEALACYRQAVKLCPMIPTITGTWRLTSYPAEISAKDGTNSNGGCDRRMQTESWFLAAAVERLRPHRQNNPAALRRRVWRCDSIHSICRARRSAWRANPSRLPG